MCNSMCIVTGSNGSIAHHMVGLRNSETAMQASDADATPTWEDTPMNERILYCRQM